MKPHKWAKEIKAWADGAEIQHRLGDCWRDCEKPVWGEQTEYRIKPQGIKCITKDCINHSNEGKFVGDLCEPCWNYIANGKGIHSQAYRNAQPKEPQYLYVYRGYGKQQITGTKAECIPCVVGDKMIEIPYIGKIKLEE